MGEEETVKKGMRPECSKKIEVKGQVERACKCPGKSGSRDWD